MRNNTLSAVAERLESRRLFDATLSGNELSITGTDGDDVIVVALDTRKGLIEVNINGQSSWHAAAGVTKVRAMLGTGNDRLDATWTPIHFHADGEAGNDTLIGGDADDCLIGGLDNDSVVGGIGADSLSGNGGKDYLDGGPGRDRLDGGKTNDILRGGSSNDRLIGGEGSDMLYGDGGDDLFYCEGIFPDTLYGGSGNDRAYADVGDLLESIETRLDPID